ncbi:MAG: hypothetical protein P0S94_03625 [Simkaniaceae bacterium]|nr:hypothetical protein [Simkaniaceae bacterium]
MKKLGMLCALATLSLCAVEDMTDLTSPVVSAATQETMKAPLPMMQTEETNVFITNDADHEVGVEWSVSLSDHYKMNGYERVLPAKKDHAGSDRFSWLVNEKEAAANPVFNIDVKVYNEVGGRKLVAQKSVQKTLSHAQIHGNKSPTNLHITYKGKGVVNIALMRE